LAEQQTFVGRAHETPDDHRDAGDDTDVPAGATVLDREQREPQECVFRALDERHGHAPADLTGVVDAEPLVRQVSSAVHHELGTEYASERPASDQRRHERIGETRQ